VAAEHVPAAVVVAAKHVPAAVVVVVAERVPAAVAVVAEHIPAAAVVISSPATVELNCQTEKTGGAKLPCLFCNVFKFLIIPASRNFQNRDDGNKQYKDFRRQASSEDACISSVFKQVRSCGGGQAGLL